MTTKELTDKINDLSAVCDMSKVVAMFGGLDHIRYGSFHVASLATNMENLQPPTAPAQLAACLDELPTGQYIHTWPCTYMSP